MMSIWRRAFLAAAILFAFGLLTVLTQIGGIVLLLVLVLRWALKWPRHRLGGIALFLGLYAAAAVSITFIAPVFGRVPLPCRETVQSPLVVRSLMLCAMNRHYVAPKMKDAVLALSRDMEHRFPGTTTVALDANFPFLDGFPLLPHLSHADGRKLDIAFYYADDQGRFLNGQTPSPLGYFAFEQPADGDPQPCAGRRDRLTLRWDLDFLQTMRSGWRLEEERTRAALTWFLEHGQQYGVDKIFVEPHIAHRLNISDDMIRFQGCRAARHDDHIHMQVTP